MSYIIMDSKIGKITIAEEKGFITEVSFGQQKMNMPQESNELLEKTRQQLELYFQGKLQNFDVPLNPKGTPFRERVWKALQQIPYGQTISYGQLAETIGKPKAMRAVGGANHHNPISIIIPCHRVIGADGSLTGYGGGLTIKKFLLDLESENKSINQL